MNFRAAGRVRREPVLDMTPLIDCVFLLLIFFLVTATFAQQDRAVIPIDLPEGTSGQTSAAADRTTLLIQPDGTVTIELRDGTVIEAAGEGDLRARLEALRTEDPDRPLRLRADQEVPYGDVMQVWDMAREVGFRRVENEIFAGE